MKKKRNILFWKKISLDQLKFQENQIPSSITIEEIYSKTYTFI